MARDRLPGCAVPAQAPRVPASQPGPGGVGHLDWTGWPRVLESRALRGAVAQLGERRVRNAKVEGSIPLRSTTFLPPRIKHLALRADQADSSSGSDVAIHAPDGHSLGFAILPELVESPIVDPSMNLSPM